MLSAINRRFTKIRKSGLLRPERELSSVDEHPRAKCQRPDSPLAQKSPYRDPRLPDLWPTDTPRSDPRIEGETPLLFEAVPGAGRGTLEPVRG